MRESRKIIRNTALAAILAALIVVMLVAGGVFDLFDLLVVSVCSLVLHVVIVEMGAKWSFLIYAVSSALALILLPFATTTLYFVSFFGYYPVLRRFVYAKIKSKKIAVLLMFLWYSAVMAALYTVFKTLFGVEGEPPAMIALLYGSAAVFYLAFELLMSRIIILYALKIRPRLFGKKGNRK